MEAEIPKLCKNYLTDDFLFGNYPWVPDVKEVLFLTNGYWHMAVAEYGIASAQAGAKNICLPVKDLWEDSHWDKTLP